MVRMPAWVAMLDRKLLRDLWEMKGQALAVAAVVAAGVSMFVTYLSNFDTLRRTRDAYYESARFADVFASMTRAPAALAPRLAAIPGVQSVATRVVADVTLDVAGMDEPASGRLISLPESGRPLHNDLYLRAGRWIDPTRHDEVLVSEMFAEANRLGPGGEVTAIINGRRRTLAIVGVALSPEYVYAIRPGDLFPDKRRFGLFWMGREALASAFDMEGGFNDVSIVLARGASSAEVIAALDHLIEPYGGLGAVPRAQQSSAWMLENELSQLQTFGFITPLIFFSVAAFILNVALTRALALQRPQVASLKALGYSNGELTWHYIKWAILVATMGSVAGVGLGAWMGAGMTSLYNAYFRFPQPDYHLSLDVAIQSVLASIAVAVLGAQSAVRRAVRVPPAEAMQTERPARYRRSVIERSWLPVRFPLTARMIARNLERQPVRALTSVTGIALAVAVLLVGLSFIDVMNLLIDQQFGLAQRQDATVGFVEPRALRAVHDVRHMPGVMAVEAMRSVPVRFRAGPRTRTLAITGLTEQPTLSRVVDRSGRAIAIPAAGLVLSSMLGEILDLAPGDLVRVEVLAGERRILNLPVMALVDDSMGLQAYMRIDVLNRAIGEGDAISGAAMSVDPAVRHHFYREVKAMPVVAGVALREMTLRNFRETMAETMNLQIFLNVFFAGVIAFGVVYNSARVSLSERSRELASLRVLGFTRAEISLILLGELAILTLAALPVGALLGYGLGALIMLGFSNEVYRLSYIVTAPTVAWAFLIVIAASFLSGLLVRRRLDHLDLVAVLKGRD